MAKSDSKKTTLTVREFARRVAEMFPPELAESWDNVGLQVGDPTAMVARLMTCLEVTQSTLAEARRRKADTILAHHPLIFKPMKELLTTHPSQALVHELIRHGINLIVAHTNMDSAAWGTNQVLAEACGLMPLGPLDPRILAGKNFGQLKFVIFVPKGHETTIIEAIHRGGSGRIGLYDHCTFRSEGTGTFRGGEGANPFMGEAGKLEQADEYRLEAIVSASQRATLLKEVLKAHPYEEPAYDFYPLAAAQSSAAQVGLGCMARTPKPMSVEKLAEQIKAGLKLDQIRASGPPRKKIQTIAICSGSGGSLLGKAASHGADAFITGEVNYHHGVEAHQRGMTVFEVGHFESEQIVARPLAGRLKKKDWIRESSVTVFDARDDLQPFRIF